MNDSGSINAPSALASAATATSAHRRAAKKAIRFSLMVAGQSGLGKTTLLTTLFEDKISPPQESSDRPNQFHVYAPTDSIKTYAFEMDVPDDGNRLMIEAIDTPGFNDDVDPEQRLAEILAFIEQSFDEVFDEEQRIHRNPKFEEHRVHVLLYLLEPTGLGLKDIDAQFMSQLADRVNVVPVIAKADGMTAKERAQFKKQIMDDIRRQGIPIFQFPEMNSEATVESMHAGGSSGGVPAAEPQLNLIKSDMLPFSVIGAVTPRPKDQKRGRPYPWGLVEVDNPMHCDFGALRRAILVAYREELKESTEDGLYERYRTEKLLHKGNSTGNMAGSTEITV